MDEAFLDVPVARAVRASAGFSVAFRPVDIPEGPGGDWYVDGGVISNFPAWVFSHEFRRRLATHADYHGFASRPWLHVGLRVEADTPRSQDLVSPGEFVRSMLSLLLGQARNDLEARVTDLISRSVTIRQPLRDTQGPENLLDFDRMRREQIWAMVNRGERFAERSLQQLSFTLPRPRSIQPFLRDLIAEVQLLFDDARCGPFAFRSNIFIPQEKDLVLMYQVNMDADPDRDLVLGFNQGLTGFCFTRRVPLACDLERFAGELQSGRYTRNELFGFDPPTQQKIRPDRTWLVSVPIFDPYAAYPRELSSGRDPQGHVEGVDYSDFPGTLDGAVYGVLNLDAALSYERISMSRELRATFESPTTHARISLTTRPWMSVRL